MSVAFIGGRGVGGKYGGIETFYENVPVRLARRGHDVTIYCRRHFTPDDYVIPGVRLARLPSTGGKHLDTPVHSVLSTVHALLSRHDVVHYQALGSSLLSWVPRLCGTATVATVHGLDWQRAKWGRVARLVLRTGEWASVKLADRTTTNSKNLAAELQRKYRKAVHYIPNGVDPFPIPPPVNLDRYGLEPKGYLLFAGRLSPEKGCHTLLEAYLGSRTSMPLVFAGGSIDKKYEQVLRSQAPERVRFLGYVDSAALGELYAHAYLFVLPSFLEGLSLSLLEAMSYGCPVVASDIPENRDVLEDTGFTFPPGDAARLRELLDELLERPDLLEEKAAAARRLVMENYTWEDVVGRFEALYAGLLGSDGPPSDRERSGSEARPEGLKGPA
ncbi:MAG TPA: glycosyltransferase family 4 protein [Gemmatimonadota bacterium]|jgi:glycosyltransferase involved in cell wall biosynthesis